MINQYAPAQTLPGDLIRAKIMPFLSFKECGAMALVCKIWGRAILEPREYGFSALDNKLLAHVVFGKKEWEQIPGVADVGEEPELTDDQKIRLVAKLKGLCSYFNKDDKIKPHRFQSSKNNRYWQTRRVILFPETINGYQVDFPLIGKIFSFEKTVKNNGTLFGFITGDEKSEFRKEKVKESKFCIVSLDVIPGSRGTTHAIKEGLLKAKGCRVPTPLEQLISTVVLNVTPPKAGENYFFGREGQWSTFSATDTLLNGLRLVVGAASASGPMVNPDYVDFNDVGVSAFEEVL